MAKGFLDQLTVGGGSGKRIIVLVEVHRAVRITHRSKHALSLLGLTAAALLTLGPALAADVVGTPSRQDEPNQSAGLTSGGSDNGDYANTLMLKEFTLFGGGFFPYIDSSVQFDGPDIPGTEIDFEDVLGVEDSIATFLVEGRWRIDPKHRIELAYFELNRDGANAVDGTFQFGDLTIPFGAAVEATSNISLGRITYGYSFFNDGEKELGAVIGAHIATLDTSVALQAGVAGVVGSSTSDSFQITAPLPHVGLVGSYAFTPKFVAEGKIIGFYLSFNNYTGRLFQADLKLMYQVWDNVSLGVGAQYFTFKLDRDSGSNFEGASDLEFVGPTAFITLAF